MKALTALDMAKNRMADLRASTELATVSVFGGPQENLIGGSHSFHMKLCNIREGDTLRLESLAVDQILFVLEGAVLVKQGDESTTASRWDCLAMAANTPIDIRAANSHPRLLHIVPTVESYEAVGHKPTVAGPFDTSRAARWGEVKGYDDAFATSREPGLEKRVFKLLNRGISKVAHALPALPHELPFSMSIVEMEPTKGAKLHSHTTEEIFIALDGSLDMFWGDAGEGRLCMGTGEMMSVPTNLMRGFRNGSDHQFHMLVMVGGWNLQSMESVVYQDGDAAMQVTEAQAVG